MRIGDYHAWHFIGIKGAGMTALAELFVGLGKKVTGSDTAEVFYTDAILKRLGITVWSPFDPAHITDRAEAFVYSTAYTVENNTELAAAKATGRQVLSYPEALGLLTREKMTLAICGTHGKTTTSAWLAETFRNAGVDPSAIIGSEIRDWGGSALSGKGPYFVIEADEYQNKLAQYHPFGVILTSVDWDHPDFFKTVEEYERVFVDFVKRVPRHGFVIACNDHARAEFLTRDLGCARLTYGFLDGASVRAVDHRVLSEDERQDGLLQEFFVEYQNEKIGPFRIRLAGRHNVLNALAVIATALHLKLDREKIAAGLAHFTGTKRRFELLGEHKGGLVYDDYAHHPAEIRATLSAFRQVYPNRRLFVIFHPHTFTRTKALLEEFGDSFGEADGVAVIDIYGSARETQGGVSAQDLVDRINHFTPEKAVYAPDRTRLAEELRTSLTPDSLVVTMGAGDVWQIGQTILKK